MTELLSLDNLWLVYGDHRTTVCSPLLVMGFTPGNPNHFCFFQLPSRTSWFPSRTRGRGKGCAQPRSARPMGRSSVGAEEYRFVWWRSSQGKSGLPYHSLSASQAIIGHRFWRERRSNVCIPSQPQRRFFNCCPSYCTPYSLAYWRGTSSHDDKYHRSSNQEQHPVFLSLMAIMKHPLGCFLQTAYNPVPRHQKTIRFRALGPPARQILFPL